MTYNVQIYICETESPIPSAKNSFSNKKLGLIHGGYLLLRGGRGTRERGLLGPMPVYYCYCYQLLSLRLLTHLQLISVLREITLILSRTSTGNASAQKAPIYPLYFR